MFDFGDILNEMADSQLNLVLIEISNRLIDEYGNQNGLKFSEIKDRELLLASPIGIFIVVAWKEGMITAKQLKQFEKMLEKHYDNEKNVLVFDADLAKTCLRICSLINQKMKSE